MTQLFKQASKQASKFSVTLPLAITAAFTFSAPAQASLTSYTANGVDFVRMQGAGFDVSFTKDGNLFKTLVNSYAGGAAAFVNAVIASVSGGKISDAPNVYDTPANSGYHTLSSSDFNTSTGQVSWFGAKAYVSYLNNISYGGATNGAYPVGPIPARQARNTATTTRIKAITSTPAAPRWRNCTMAS